jgi:hypothetical protein
MHLASKVDIAKVFQQVMIVKVPLNNYSGL